MSKYLVTVDWSGYSRGFSQYEVEANSEEEAMENYWNGECVNTCTVRDDTEGEASSAKLIGETNE